LLPARLFLWPPFTIATSQAEEVVVGLDNFDRTRETNVRTRAAITLITLAICLSVGLHASTFYVDARAGNDSNLGISPGAPWQTLQKVNANRFKAGDRIMFHAGSHWEGQLALTNSGTESSPIIVDRYGKGPLPRIDGQGKVENVIQLVNVEWVEVRHLEITNHGEQPGVRRAVLIATANFGTAHHLRISDLYIHDVNGTNARKDNGGILFRTLGDKVPSRFDGLVIERNIIWKVDRSAIAGESNQIDRARWFPSLHVVIRDNFVEDVGGDGIVPWATDHALIERNVVLHCNERAGSYNAGIWPWSTDSSLFELNEAAFTHSTRDGEGFDSDYNSKNSTFRYNYSHDNDGGFMLICTPAKRDPEKNIGNTGTVVEYNISRNDHARIFNLSGADQTTVEHNAVYTSEHEDVQIVLTSSWDGWSNGAVFRGNTFDVAGIGRYGHGIDRGSDGAYRIAPGWGGATGVVFERNEFFGHNIDLPYDPSATVDAKYHAARVNWREPVFDPANPRRFSAYLKKHRQWMLQLFAKQLGRIPDPNLKLWASP
jgi:hypothetical protein